MKNFLWHRRDERADTEVIGRSRWLYCRYLGRHNLSLGFEPLAHHPHGHSLVGDWSGEKAAQPTSSHLTAPYTHDEVAEWKSKYFHCQNVSSKDLISLNMSFPSVCPVAIKGGCVYDGKGDVIVTMQAWEQKASLRFLCQLEENWGVSPKTLKTDKQSEKRRREIKMPNKILHRVTQWTATGTPGSCNPKRYSSAGRTLEMLRCHVSAKS